MDVQAVADLKAVKTRITETNKQLEELKRTETRLKQHIIEDMDLDGVSLARTDFGTVSVTKTDVASVKDWAEFEEYIYANRALHLLQRRASDPAYREELAAMGAIPGVETFTKVNLSLTNKVT